MKDPTERVTTQHVTPYQRHIGLEHRNVTRWSPNGYQTIEECADCQLSFLFTPVAGSWIYPTTIYEYPYGTDQEIAQ